jgi:hypothetical protein
MLSKGLPYEIKIKFAIDVFKKVDKQMEHSYCDIDPDVYLIIGQIRILFLSTLASWF